MTKSILHVAAAFDIPGLIGSILRTSSMLSINSTQNGWSPLILAVEGGQASVTKELLRLESHHIRRLDYLGGGTDHDSCKSAATVKKGTHR